ncbi:unnamed protein product [Arabidopsis halleri]
MGICSDVEGTAYTKEKVVYVVLLTRIMLFFEVVSVEIVKTDELFLSLKAYGSCNSC